MLETGLALEVKINHDNKPTLRAYKHVPPWITLERQTPPFREMISPENWPPEHIEVQGEIWVFRAPNLWILQQFLPDPYHTRYSHLGFYHLGWSGEETRTIRAFELEGEGEAVGIAYHWFIQDRRQLEAVYEGVPKEVTDWLFRKG